MQYCNTVDPRSPLPGLDIKTVFPKYGDPRDDNTVEKSNYLYNGDTYSGKTTSLYWDHPVFH